MNAADRFFAKVTPGPNGCLLWTGALDPNGYGRFQGIDGRNMPAHRWLLERVLGRNAHLVTDHLCRVTSCVRPTHLEFVTSSENIRRGIGPARIKAKAAARTHCKNGHPLTGENLYVYAGKNGRTSRLCKQCQRDNQKTPARRAWNAYKQRCLRANIGLLERNPIVAVLHGGHAPRVRVEVFTGDTPEFLTAASARAIADYTSTLAAVRA